MYTSTIRIYRPEPKYDVEAYTYKTGQRVLDDSHAKERAEIQADSEMDRFFERCYQKALADVRACTKFFKAQKATADVTSDDKIATLPAYYELQFVMPWDKSVDLEKTLVAYIHDYMVHYSLSEWFKVTLPSESEPCLLKAQEVFAQIPALFNQAAPTKRRS